MIIEAENAKLWEHQAEGVRRALDHGDYALFFEQGTGKTLTAITLLRYLFRGYGKPLRTLIVCPAIVVDNWEDEFKRFSKCADLVQTLKDSGVKRRAALATPGKSIFITNPECFDMDGVFWESKGKLKKLRDLFDVIVVDESHRFKNGAAKRTKMCIRLADKSKHNFILTGTPILNSPEDIWAQFRILDRGKTFGMTFMSFRNEYFVDHNAGKPASVYWPDWKLRPGMEPVLNGLIYKKAMRVDKSTCLSLPPLVSKRIQIGMSAEQRKHYLSMMADYVTFLDSKACTAALALTRSLRLMQIVSGFLPLDKDGYVPFKDDVRAKVLGELLEDHANQPLIIWAAFRANYAAIAKVCDENKISYGFLTGEQSQKEKDQNVKDFCAGKFRVLIAAPGAGGTGVNLIQAPTAIWYSRNFSLEHRLQSQARNYRGGSEMHGSVLQIDLVCPETIDDACLAALERKENVAENILKFSRALLDSQQACMG